MILSGSEILDAVHRSEIVIEPFDQEAVGPNSYDFRLGDRGLMYENLALDPKIDNPIRPFSVPSDGFMLSPDKVYLVNSHEVVGSSIYVPIVRGRSSVGRLGLFIHITADLIDVGSVNQLTLQLHCVQPVRIYPMMLIGQVTFWRIDGEVNLYQGKYASEMSPVRSLAFKDWDER